MYIIIKDNNICGLFSNEKRAYELYNKMIEGFKDHDYSFNENEKINRIQII